MDRHKNNMKKPGNKPPQTAHNNSTTDPIDITVEKMSGKEFRKSIVKSIQ